MQQLAYDWAFPDILVGMGLFPNPESNLELRNDDDNVINWVGGLTRASAELCTS